jgi:hypothetical protein
VSDLSRTPRFGRERQARRAGHAANVLRGVALAGLAAGDPMPFDVVPVNETNFGFHRDLRDAARRFITGQPTCSSLGTISQSIKRSAGISAPVRSFVGQAGFNALAYENLGALKQHPKLITRLTRAIPATFRAVDPAQRLRELHFRVALLDEDLVELSQSRLELTVGVVHRLLRALGDLPTTSRRGDRSDPATGHPS